MRSLRLAVINEPGTHDENKLVRQLFHYNGKDAAQEFHNRLHARFEIRGTAKSCSGAAAKIYRVEGSTDIFSAHGRRRAYAAASASAARLPARRCLLPAMMIVKMIDDFRHTCVSRLTRRGQPPFHISFSRWHALPRRLVAIVARVTIALSCGTVLPLPAMARQYPAIRRYHCDFTVGTGTMLSIPREGPTRRPLAARPHINDDAASSVGVIVIAGPMPYLAPNNYHHSILTICMRADGWPAYMKIDGTIRTVFRPAEELA